MRKKPASVHVLAGTARTDRNAPKLAGIPPLPDVPPVPGWLESNPVAAAEWDRLAPVLVDARLLTAGTVSLLAVLCLTYSRLVDVEKSGLPLNAAAVNALRLLCIELAITPGSLGKAQLQAPPKTNPFAEFAHSKS